MIKTELLKNWAGMPAGNATPIKSLCDNGFDSWTIKMGGKYGVAMPVSDQEEISESFSGAYYYTDRIKMHENEERSVLMLMTDKDEIKDQFASLCAELLNPGENGELRRDITTNPASWWSQWKELLGNKSVDSRVYDALGELWTLKYLLSKGIHAEWNGPNGATYDIDCDTYYTEVKSTIARNKRQITLSNVFQLDPPDGKKLFLVLCQFEAALSGISINGLVDELEELGYSRDSLNDKLEGIGLEKGKIARKRCYDLHAATKYTIDNSFPAIRNTSFVGGNIPEGIMSITYTVSLDGIAGENLLVDGEKYINV